MRRVLHLLTSWLAIIGIVVGGCAVASAQGRDTEPNNGCMTAQIINWDDPGSLYYTVVGSLDTPPYAPDVDFFRFAGTPVISGTLIRIDLEGQPTGKGTLSDSLLGVFDSDCYPIKMDDDAGEGYNSMLTFTLPWNGVFVVAATSYGDNNFSGRGSFPGSYTLTVKVIEGTSISGRVIDAITRAPLLGDQPPHTGVELLKCYDSYCNQISWQNTDKYGQFRFDRDWGGTPLPSGIYQVVAHAEQYGDNRTDRLDIGEGENRNLGDIPLQPVPVQLSELKPCVDLPPEGGLCRYKVKVTNRLSVPVTGIIWSIGDAGQTGSLLGRTEFQIGKRDLELAPQQSKYVGFSINIPGTVQYSVCFSIYVGQEPDFTFNTVAETNFCVAKQSNGSFQVMTEQESRMLRQQQQPASGKAPTMLMERPSKPK